MPRYNRDRELCSAFGIVATIIVEIDDMIDQKTAIEIAWKEVRKRGLEVLDVVRSRKILSKDIPEIGLKKSDYWVISFNFKIPHNEVWSRESVSIWIDCKDGEILQHD